MYVTVVVGVDIDHNAEDDEPCLRRAGTRRAGLGVANLSGCEYSVDVHRVATNDKHKYDYLYQ